MASISTTDLAIQWRAALADVVVRHPDRRSTPIIEVQDGDPPRLYVGLDRAWCTSDPEKSRAPFAISTVELAFFPGRDLARAWFTAAWVGYLQHEALELVTVGDLQTKILDPHAEPYPLNPYNRGLRDGLPVRLTPQSMYDALRIVMSGPEATGMMRRAGLEI